MHNLAARNLEHCQRRPCDFVKKPLTNIHHIVRRSLAVEQGHNLTRLSVRAI